MSSMAFIQSPIDRLANHRDEPEWLKAEMARPETSFIQVFGDGVRMRDNELVTSRPDGIEEFVFLGHDEVQKPWFAFSRKSEGDMSPLRPLMLNHVLPPERLSMLAQARSLVHWHERHGFCSNCGHKTEMSDGGYRRHCPSCKTDHFPRTDPVVIMAVRSGDNILLGRQAAWAPGMYSAIAGFMEPGETIEQAVAREVREETGVVVGQVHYAASQPWPFPSTLMIGCIAEAEHQEIILDQKELENARWFTRDEVRLMLEQKHPEKLTASNPWAIAHHVISAALQ